MKNRQRTTVGFEPGTAQNIGSYEMDGRDCKIGDGHLTNFASCRSAPQKMACGIVYTCLYGV
jgi:hypothetical protein